MDKLRVRGKRRRREVDQPLDIMPKPRGRPMKPASELAANRKKVRLPEIRITDLASPSTMMRDPQKQALLSSLERLPVELMQQIFYYCLEINIVKASHFVRRMLSTDLTYNLLILFAFFDDDGIHPVEVKHFHPATYRELPAEAKVRLQRGILSFRWCTLERVKACMPILTRLKMVQEWHKEHTGSKANPAQPSPDEQQHPSRLPTLPPIEGSQELERYFSVHPRRNIVDGMIEYDDTTYIPKLQPHFFAEDVDGPFRKLAPRGHLLDFPSTLAVRHIPDKIVTGKPWTTDKLDFLRLLVHGSRYLQKDLILHVSPQAIFSGMKDAIEESNSLALLVLLDLHDAAFHIAFVNIYHWPVRNWNPHNQHFTTTHSHPIPLSLFHLATQREYKVSSTLLALLARAGIDSLPKDDAVMTKWALQASALVPDSRSFPTWLLRYMDGSLDDSACNGVNGRMFEHGKAHTDILWAGRESFARELGYVDRAMYNDPIFSVQVEMGNFV